MNELKFLFYLIFSISIQNANLPVSSIGLSFDCVIDTKPFVQKKKKRFRWKRVFRPIKIFKKKVSYWLKRLFLVVSLIGLLGYLFDRGDIGFSGRFVEIVASTIIGVFILCSFAIILLFIAIPIIVIVRIFKELKWNKRSRKCYKF